MSKTPNNQEKELKEIEKIHEYLEARKEIFEFVLRRKVLNIILCYLGIASVVAWLGLGAFIDHRVKGKVETRLSEMIDEEYTYLSERNTITELGDTAISTQDVKYYEDLKGYLSSKQPQRIRTAAKAELLRITSYLSTWGYQPFDPENTKAHEMSADQLHELYEETDSIAQKMAALFFLRYRFNKETPDFLLEIAKSTENLRLRYISLSTLQALLKNYSEDTLDYEENLELWRKNKELFYERIGKSEKQED